MRFTSHKIIIANANPHVPEGPELADFAQGEPIKVGRVGRGQNAPTIHHFADHKAFSKERAAPIAFEPLAYHLGQKFGVNIPHTAIRNLPIDTGVLSKPHSVQRGVEGDTMYDLNLNLGKPSSAAPPSEVTNHPDFHKMAMYDWLTGNTDRHEANYMVSKDGGIHAIDNEFAFDYYHPETRWHNNSVRRSGRDAHGNVIHANDIEEDDNLISRNLGHIGSHHPVPSDFRNAIMGANEAEHRQLIENALQHKVGMAGMKYRQNMGLVMPWFKNIPTAEIPQMVSQEYADRLNTLKKHFSDPQLQTMGQLRDRLYPVSEI